ncbi:hypothetical protein NVP1244A_100 [Vibrio phage 1.244.A._10N.261.54.C3]|nr:hypothetical protein NVP1244A_100 [Vibrio phage 1.244.A._10N.261.54.C3]AUR98728.1 hypothetical protein NVP1255O_100 [Vibrio phage 1.255.O._10N.286.45.F1]
MITINKVVKEQLNYIQPGNAIAGVWYPITQRGLNDNVVGFVRYLGGLGKESFVMVFEGVGPILTSGHEIESHLASSDAVILDKVVEISLDLGHTEVTTKFGDVPAHGTFSSSDKQWLKIGERTAMRQDDGAISAFGEGSLVTKQGGQSGIQINYSEK